jgi:hypothetical protein
MCASRAISASVRTSLLLLALIASPAVLYAGPGPEQLATGSTRTQDARILYEIPTGGDAAAGARRLYFAPGNLYPPYAADPFRVGFGFEPVHVVRDRIPATSTSRVSLRAGGLITVVRSEQDERPGTGWQVSLLGGFNDQNDVRNHLDNIGWDGRYGLVVMAAREPGLAFKAGVLHVSSHLGDEYMERTGTRRIGYTRQEVAGGVSWFATDRWRWYVEAGRSIFLGNRQLQDRWRTQWGVEYESSPVLWRHRAAWYAASDMQAMQERDWRVDVSVQGGFVVHSAGRTWRLGASWYNGRPMIGEFFQYTERYITVGLWIDI